MELLVFFFGGCLWKYTLEEKEEQERARQPAASSSSAGNSGGVRKKITRKKERRCFMIWNALWPSTPWRARIRSSLGTHCDPRYHLPSPLLNFGAGSVLVLFVSSYFASSPVWDFFSFPLLLLLGFFLFFLVLLVLGCFPKFAVKELFFLVLWSWCSFAGW